jgi:nitric oxide reductase large subunit
MCSCSVHSSSRCSPEPFWESGTCSRSAVTREVEHSLPHGCKWSADWLHRESELILNDWAEQEGASEYKSLAPEKQAALQARLERSMRTNTYDPTTHTVTIAPERVAAFNTLAKYYADVFQNGRPEYAIPRGALSASEKQREMAAFFWWTSWAASTNRPGTNWPLRRAFCGCSRSNPGIFGIHVTRVFSLVCSSAGQLPTEEISGTACCLALN